MKFEDKLGVVVVKQVYLVADNMKRPVEHYEFRRLADGSLKIILELGVVEDTPCLPFNELDETK